MGASKGGSKRAKISSAKIPRPHLDGIEHALPPCTRPAVSWTAPRDVGRFIAGARSEASGNSAAIPRPVQARKWHYDEDAFGIRNVSPLVLNAYRHPQTAAAHAKSVSADLHRGLNRATREVARKAIVLACLSDDPVYLRDISFKDHSIW